MSDPNEKKTFKTFADLARQLRGGEPEDLPQEEEAPPPAADSGEDADSEDGLSLRERIQSALPAFGPMDSGPPCYRDENSEEMELLASFRVRTVFPEEVLAEVASLPQDPDPSDYADRVDLRAERIFTIDGDDAKDYDDAIQIRRLPSGDIEVGVHIADVSHYVRPGTQLDMEASTRATSIYVPDQVVPMLPEALSNHLCSLVPNRDRLAFSVLMVFDSAGARLSKRVHKSVIRSNFRCTYKIVQKLLDGIADADTERLAPIRQDLFLFQDWTKTQQTLRDRAGSLRMQSSERKFEFDKDHEVKRIYPSEPLFSQALIEETALAANQAVGDIFKEMKLPTIYRIHPRKDPEEIAGVVEMLAKCGIRVPDKDFLTGRDVGRLIREARRRQNSEALIARIMGLVERAVYEVANAEDTAEHWGLAREHYLHFTSPIRRYPDLIVHRWLHEVCSGGREAEGRLLEPERVADLVDVAGHSSLQADLASMVESAISDLKVCQYMDRYRGQELRSTIQRVAPYGLEVFLSEHWVTGFIPAKSLEGRTKVDGPKMTVQSRRGSRVLEEGGPVKVRVKDVDFVRLQVILELIP
jgi:ribonuclease R